jgi:GNAT superfamily N-acetyltransferase
VVQGIRPGVLSDVRGLVRLHEGCSDQTVLRRYLSPLPVLSPRLAARLLMPPGGFSVVAERRGGLVGIVSIAPDGEGVGEVGALVADAWQRQGIGTQLLMAATRRASESFGELFLVAHPSNGAVMPMVHAAGLRALVRQRDGLLQVRVPLGGRAHQGEAGHSDGRVPMAPR